MEKEQEEQQQKKALGRVKTADRVRLVFLCIALFLVLFVFFGNKVLAGTVWYEACRGTLYYALAADIVFMFCATLTKLFLTAVYNRLIKKDKEC